MNRDSLFLELENFTSPGYASNRVIGYPVELRPLGRLVQSDRPICYGVLKRSDHAADGVPLVRITDLEDGRVVGDSLFRISHELDTEFGRSRLRGGELLLSIQGTIGRLAIAPQTLRGANISRTIAE